MEFTYIAKVVQELWKAPLYGTNEKHRMIHLSEEVSVQWCPLHNGDSQFRLYLNLDTDYPKGVYLTIAGWKQLADILPMIS